MSNELKNILETILVQSHKLHQCLKQESDFLATKNYTELAELAKEKQQLVDELNQLDKQRESFAHNTEFSLFLKNLDPALSLAKIGEGIQSNIRQCQYLNEMNGRVLQRHQRIARETVELLTGRQISQAGTYDANGVALSQGSMFTNVEA